jgi:hypothetical protein
MRVCDLALVPSSAADEVSALVGGFRLSYRVSPAGLAAASADAFLAAALLPAMARGEALELDPAYSASPALLQGMEQLQEVFSAWNPALRRVRVSARAATPPAPRPGAASFFSGGLDSLYTFLEGRDLSHAIQIHGFDYGRDNRALAEEAERRNREFVEGRGRRFVVVESNHRDLYAEHRLDITAYHGASLASIGLALGFERIHIPASHGWTSLFPWGSHPVVDPLWSSESVRIVHDGIAAGRPDKLRRVALDPEALALLRVCFDAYNCQVCEKCLRTRFALRALGLRAPTLEPLGSTWRIYGLRLDTERFRHHWLENHALALEVGDSALSRAAAFCLTRGELHQLFVSIDRRFLGGRGRDALRAAKRLILRTTRRAPAIRFDPGND